MWFDYPKIHLTCKQTKLFTPINIIKSIQKCLKFIGKNIERTY